MTENNAPNSRPYVDYATWFRQNEQRKRMEKKDIRYLGFMTGAAILLMILFENIIVLALEVTGLYDDYLQNATFRLGIDIVLRVIATLLPFLIFSVPMKRRTGIEVVVPLEKPHDIKLSVLGIIAGLGFCMLADILTSYFVVFIQAFGFELSTPDMPTPGGMAGFVLSVIHAAIVAAMVEEISLRGCTMQPLRKYGDGFAVVMSACAFGLMHCNMVQIPFALTAGLALGYIAIKTGSIWPSIIVHALNNFISTAVSYMVKSGENEELLNIAYAALLYSIMFVGLIAFFFFSKRAKQVSPKREVRTALSFPAKAFAYVTNPSMIIAIIIMLYVTSTFVKRG